MVAVNLWPTAAGDAGEDQWSKMVRRWFNDGVHAGALDDLRPYGDETGMQVKVAAGEGLIRGFHFESPSLQTLAIPAADASNDRIDRVVVRLTRGEDNATANLIVVAGVAASNPAAPALQDSNTSVDIPIARVNVGSGESTIRPQDVMDDRIVVTPQVNEQVGVVKLMYALVAPTGYLAMKGQTVQTADYPFLARLWGLESVPTMVIPDMTNMFPRGYQGSVGAVAGSDTVTLSVNNMPSHNHSFNPTPHNHTIVGDSGFRIAVSAAPSSLRLVNSGTQGGSQEVSFTSLDAATAGGSIGSNGGGQSFSIVPRYRSFMFMIKAH